MDLKSIQLSCSILLIALVQLSVQQTDHAPVFTQTLRDVLQIQGIVENTPIGTTVGFVSCTDQDGDPIIRYQVNSQTLAIHPQTGAVTITRLLDKENVPSQTLEKERILKVVFLCYSTTLSAQVTIDITVVDENDNNPIFLNTPYAASIIESAPNGTTLYPGIFIEDKDTGLNAEVDVSCITPDSDATLACELFDLKSFQRGQGNYSVQIILKGQLDYEQRRDYKMTIEAVDRGPGNRNSTVNILIKVLDTQDTPPAFLNTPILLYVDENAPLNTRMDVALSARDGDTGNPRPVKIDILEDRDNLFRIGASYVSDNATSTYSAPVFVNANIDREKYLGEYNFRVRAVEMNNNLETTATATATVQVSILDKNDNAPQFSNSSYTVNLAEIDSSSQNSNVQIPDLSIVITDQDEASNARYRVVIFTQNFDTFRIFPDSNVTGNIAVSLVVKNASLLDYDTPAYRTQTVVLHAVELGVPSPQTSSATVTINLLDVNDNVPIFTRQNNNAAIPEDAKVGRSIVTVSATDLDSGPNGNVTYALAGAGSNTFSIDPITGLVTLSQPVDYETQNQYPIIFEAMDQGQPRRLTRQQATISITNVNDQAPIFRQSQYRTYAFETSLNLLPAVRVQAFDQEDPNATITYSIIGGNIDNAFVINSVSGVLTLAKNVDFDKTEGRSGQFRVIVQASDNGQPPMVSNTTVIVNVQDENNNSPVFARPLYVRNISEIAGSGYLVVAVNASDADQGQNGLIRYQISGGSRDHFVIDPDRGVITVSSRAQFDYNSYPRYDMRVYAIDKGSPPRTGTTTVLVNLQDANNKPPSFRQAIFTKSVKENVPIGTSVLHLTASDPDTNNRLMYEIPRESIQARNSGGSIISPQLPFNFQDAFRINNETGLIETNNLLRRSYAAEISFNVRVTDRNAQTPNQQATTSILVTILGSNISSIAFNPPWTPQRPLYYFPVKENTPTGSIITTLGARDPACGQCLLSNYQIVKANKYFLVERTTGRVVLNEAIDYDVPGDKRITFEVDAIASPTRSARAEVMVEITDDNDNRPIFEKTEYTFNLRENLGYPAEVGYVSATDKDSGSFGRVVYTLTGQGSEDFDIYTTGPGGIGGGLITISRTGVLDYEKRKVYNLLASAVDNPDQKTSKLQLQTSVQVTINILDVNDRTPQFSATSYEFFTVESYDAGAFVGTVVATDADSGLNKQVSYSINPETKSRVLELFRISPVTGDITTRVKLRSAALGSPYIMSVRAQDAGLPPLHSSVNVTIHVRSGQLDDGSPYWTRPLVDEIFSIREDSPINYVVTTVLANARTPNSSILYSFLNSGQGGSDSDFKIDRTTGTISVNRLLDREVKATYSLIVAALDARNATLESYRRVRIHLIDVDDESPSFTRCPDKRLRVPVEVSLTENVAIGTSVYHVQACDRDLPPFNYIQYAPELGIPICGRDRGTDFFDVNPNGLITTKVNMDRELRGEYLICVRASPSSRPVGRRKRAYNVTEMTNTNSVAYVVVTLRDLNDNGPSFTNKVQTEILSAYPTSGNIVDVLARDPDAQPNNRVRYIRQSTVFNQPNGASFTTNAAFIVNMDTGAVSVNYPTYADFSQGYFDMVIRAEDFSNSSMYDEMTLKIFVYNPAQSFRLVLKEPPVTGRNTANSVLSDLNSIRSSRVFRLEAVAAHRLSSGVDVTQTDICFIYIDNNKVRGVRTAYDVVVDEQVYRAVMNKYGSTAPGSCYASQTSLTEVKWADLWWVLVAVAGFIFICSIILIIVVCILYSNYKSYMTTRKTYLVEN